MSEIIKLEEKNNVVAYDDLEFKDNIIDNIENIKKYYTCSKWGYFSCQHHGYEKDKITLMREIYKDNGYKNEYKLKTMIRNGIKKKCKI